MTAVRIGAWLLTGGRQMVILILFTPINMRFYFIQTTTASAIGQCMSQMMVAYFGPATREPRQRPARSRHVITIMGMLLGRPSTTGMVLLSSTTGCLIRSGWCDLLRRHPGQWHVAR